VSRYRISRFWHFCCSVFLSPCCDPRNSDTLSNQRSRSKPDLTTQITSRFRISRNRHSWCQVTLSLQSFDPRCRCAPFHVLALLVIGLGPYDRQHMTSVKPLIGVSVFSMSPCTCLQNSRSSDPRFSDEASCRASPGGARSLPRLSPSQLLQIWRLTGVCFRSDSSYPLSDKGC